MNIDKRTIKPQPNAIATEQGWVNPATNELLVSSKGLKTYLESLEPKELSNQTFDRSETNVVTYADELPFEDSIVEQEEITSTIEQMIVEEPIIEIKEPEITTQEVQPEILTISNKSKKSK